MLWLLLACTSPDDSKNPATDSGATDSSTGGTDDTGGTDPHRGDRRRRTVLPVDPPGRAIEATAEAAIAAPPSGAAITVVDGTGDAPAPPMRSPVRLDHLSGGLATEHLTLPYGTTFLEPCVDGRPATSSRDSGVAIDVTGRIRIRTTASHRRVEVDGSPVLGGAALRSGTILCVDGIVFVVRVDGLLAPPGRPPVLVHDGERLRWPAPDVVPDTDPPITPPNPPSARRLPDLPWLSAAVPLLLGLAAWWLTGSATVAGFLAASVVYVVVSAVESRRSARRDHRHALEEFHRRLDRAAALAAERAQAWRDRTRAACPGGASLVRTDGPPPWTRAGPHRDLTVRLGRAIGPAPVPVRSDPASTDDHDEQVGTALQAALTGPSTVTVDLARSPVLGIVGPDDRVDAVGRNVVAELAALVPPGDLRIVVLAGAVRATAWAWTDWLPHSGDRTGTGSGAGAHPEPCRLLVVDGEDEAARRTAMAELADGTGTVVLWLAPDHRGLPVDVDTIVQLDGAVEAATGPAPSKRTVADDPGGSAEGSDDEPTGDARLLLHDHPPLNFAADRLDGDAAERAARRWSGYAPSTGTGALSRSPTLADMVRGSLADARACAARWLESDGHPWAPIATSGGGVVSIDLRRDGPHALVAGTTGAGKSELLRTLLIGAALHHPPTSLQFLLVDYKGGTAFGDLVDLPHTVGMVTDLDDALGGRVVVSLRAELRRRERAQRRGQSLPSLLVVVDEFATLARELPAFVDGVVDVAQRGRSLGLHLVLATQRPAGVVTDAIRANTTLRIALRVADDDDSRDVLGSTDAARLDRSAPGSALLRIGDAAPVPIRVAFSSAPFRRGPTPITVAPLHPSGRPSGRPAAPAAPRDDPRGDRGPSPSDGGTELHAAVRAAVAAAGLLELPAPRRPWCPPLPDRVTVAELGDVGADGRNTTALGLLDRPDLQRVEVAGVDIWRGGGLLITGAGGSGRSTALAALVHGESVRGAAIHVVDTTRGLAELVGGRVDVVDGSDVARTLRLLRSLAAPGPGRRRTLLVVDDWHAFADRHERINRGEAVDLIVRLATTSRRDDVRLAVSSLRPGDLPPEVVAATGHRLELRPVDGDEPAPGIGVGTNRGGGSLPPGRGVLWGHAVQVALPPATGATSTEPTPATPGIPRRDRVSDLPGAGDWTAPIGRHIADLSPAHLELRTSHLLILGPRRSGRTTLMDAVAASIETTTPDVTVLRIGAQDGVVAAAAFHQELGRLLAEPAPTTRRAGTPQVLVVVDDIDDLFESTLTGVSAVRIDDDAEVPSASEFDERLGAAIRRTETFRVLATADADGVGRCFADAPRMLRSNRRAFLLDCDPDAHPTLVHASLPLHDELAGTPAIGWLVGDGTPAAVRLALLD